MNASTLTDNDENTCISPFSGGQKLTNFAFYVHLLQPQDLITLRVVTNIDCREPFTLVAAMKDKCKLRNDNCSTSIQC